jgi:predicted ATPase/DNA-binding NarL/FixJ family response regulator
VRPNRADTASEANAAPHWVDLSSGSDRAAGNLPNNVSSFVGREEELARLRQVLADIRLLTLVGPSGVGKTRLALRLAADLQEAFADGTWLVDLSPIGDPTLVPQVLADVLGVRQPPGKSWRDALALALRPRRLLLVLDNCEHLANACAELVDGLLRACPNLRMVATSLQPLVTAGETTWRVSPLSLPHDASSDLEELQRSDAVRLFVARVRSHLPDFTLNAQNAQLVAGICRSLDGLPLALELIAARVESLGLTEVASRLDDRFRLAVGGSRSAPTRQRTLQAALEWTTSLLDEDERVLLRRLGVFVGGWTLPAAEAVCAIDGLAENTVADVLERAVARSLVVAEHLELSVRYRLLETVHDYALTQLEAVGETELVRRQHAAYLLQLAERGEPLSWDAVSAAVLQPEEGNVRAALEWTLEHDQAELGLRLAAAAFSLWLYNGHYREGLAWLERLLAAPTTAAAHGARANALTVDAQLQMTLGDFARAHERGQAALEAQQARGDAQGIALALTTLGNAALMRGDLALAGALHADAARRLREVGGKVNVINLGQLALVACEFGDASHARELIAEIEAIGEARRDPFALASAANSRGQLAAAKGDAAGAVRLFEHAVAIVRSTGNRQGTLVALTNLGHARFDEGQLGAALEAFGEAVELAYHSGERVRLLRALDGAARVVAGTNADAAVRLAGMTHGHREVLGAAAFPSERRHLESWLADARRSLGPIAYQRAWDNGHSSTLEQAVALVEALTVAPAGALRTGALSARELEVARLLAQGLTNKQIAAELVVSAATVRSHVEHILDKLDLRSRAQVAVWASQQGLLPERPPE